jgi:hypothetical protein
MAGSTRDPATTTNTEQFPKDIVALLTIAGLVLYGALVVTYNEFYQALGVKTSDVGLTYTTVLSGAAGLAVILAAVVGFAVLVAQFFKRLFGWRRLWILILFVSLFFGFVVGFGSLKARDRANAVRAGEPVAESRLFLLVLLSLTAEPVQVEPTSKTATLPPLPTTIDRPLLLLGQANATIVVYDSLVQKAVYLPASSVTLQVSNCRSPDTRQRTAAYDEACTHLRS